MIRCEVLPRFELRIYQYSSLAGNQPALRLVPVRLMNQHLNLVIPSHSTYHIDVHPSHPQVLCFLECIA